MQSPRMVDVHAAWQTLISEPSLRVTQTDQALSQLIVWASDMRRWAQKPPLSAVKGLVWLHLGPLTAQQIECNQWLPAADPLAIRQLYYLHHLGVI